MSGLPVASRKADFQSAPRAYQAAGPEGQVAALAVDTTAIAVDLTAGFSQAAYNGQVSGTGPATATRNYLAIISDVNVGVIFGPTLASVSSGNAPAIATTGTLTGNTYTGAAGTCFVIPAGTGMKFLLQAAHDKFVGIVGAASGVVRLYQISPDNA
jgi:hypothetical protein